MATVALSVVNGMTSSREKRFTDLVGGRESMGRGGEEVREGWREKWGEGKKGWEGGSVAGNINDFRTLICIICSFSTGRSCTICTSQVVVPLCLRRLLPSLVGCGLE